MKVEGWLFLGCGIFFGGSDIVYWYTSHDPTGTTALALAVGLSVLTGFYVLFTGAQQPPFGQPGDPVDGGQQLTGILAAGPGCPLAAPFVGIAEALETGLPGGLFFTGNFLFQVPAASFAGRRSVKALGGFAGAFAAGVLGRAPDPVPRSC